MPARLPRARLGAARRLALAKLRRLPVFPLDGAPRGAPSPLRSRRPVASPRARSRLPAETEAGSADQSARLRSVCVCRPLPSEGATVAGTGGKDARSRLPLHESAPCVRHGLRELPARSRKRRSSTLRPQKRRAFFSTPIFCYFVPRSRQAVQGDLAESTFLA
jgi:hypothetical protein